MGQNSLRLVVIAHEDAHRAGDVGIKNREQVALGNLLVELKRNRGLPEMKSPEEWILKLRLVLQKRVAIVEVRFHRSTSEKTGNPAFHSSEILAVRISEKLRKPCLVIARAPMEPREVNREHAQSDPRVQREHEPRKKNQVPEIHRIAAVAVWPADHESLRRNREAGPAAAFARTEVADEAVLQVTPCEQRQRPRIDLRQAAPQRGLSGEERDRPKDKRAVRGAPQPPRGAGTAHAAAASVLGMNRMKRFAATIVPARKANVAVSP